MERVRFADLVEFPDPATLPPLDRPSADRSRLTPEQQDWCRDGVVLLPGFLPPLLTDAYLARRAQHWNYLPGYMTPTPYLQIGELRTLALYPPLMALLRDLIGEPMLLHLALTAWTTSARDWHQDDYLNPAFVNGWYAAVWMALDTIDPASGPFEYVPGSHRWGLMRGEKVRSFLTSEELARREPYTGDNQWPSYAERFVTPAIDAEIAATCSEVRPFLGTRGDVLIWHGRLVHRGALATQPGLERRALICHYSGLTHRPDMPSRAQDANGHAYAVFDNPMR